MTIQEMELELFLNSRPPREEDFADAGMPPHVFVMIDDCGLPRRVMFTEDGRLVGYDDDASYGGF